MSLRSWLFLTVQVRSTPYKKTLRYRVSPLPRDPGLKTERFPLNPTLTGLHFTACTTCAVLGTSTSTCVASLWRLSMPQQKFLCCCHSMYYLKSDRQTSASIWTIGRDYRKSQNSVRRNKRENHITRKAAYASGYYWRPKKLLTDMGISGSATSSAGSTNGGSNTSQGPSGRELAIEALIDREPQGSFYRAARVVVSWYCCFCSLVF